VTTKLKGAKKKALAARVEKLEGQLAKTEEMVEKLVHHFDQELAPAVNRHGQNLTTIWLNQGSLQESQFNTDKQLAVLVRLMISKINSLIVAFEGREDMPAAITVESINDLFDLWAEFSQRPDHKELYHQWYMGYDLSQLPPPEVKEEGDPEAAEAAADNHDDPGKPREFGGDYVGPETESSDRDGVAEADSGEEAKEDEVPEVPSPDGEPDQPEDGEDG